MAVDRGSRARAASAPISGGMELAAKGGPDARGPARSQQVVQTGDLLSEPGAAARPARALVTPADNLDLDLDRTPRLVSGLGPVPGASRYALQVSRNHLFVDNVIDVENRARPGDPGAARRGDLPVAGRRLRPGGAAGPGARRGSSASASFRAAGGEKDKTPPQLDLDGRQNLR